MILSAACFINRIMAAGKPLVAFILGAPGSGKGTVCSQVVEEFGYIHLSAGDLLRAERSKEGSEYGELIQSHIQNGSIVPVEITLSLLERAMNQSLVKKFLIDGFPRNEDNLTGWNAKMEDKVNLKFVLFLQCTQEECIQRCLRRGEEAEKEGTKRTDDNEDSLRKRFNTYMDSTMPIIEHYTQCNIVKTIQANRTREEVFADVKKLFSDPTKSICKPSGVEEAPKITPEPAVDETLGEQSTAPQGKKPTTEEAPQSSSWFCQIL